MLTRSTVESLIPILKKDARRALSMSVPGFPKPYYCSFLLKDSHWFNTWASSGSTCRSQRDRSRHVFCDLRVGSYDYDQITEGGLRELDDDLESSSHCSVPIDDRDYDGLRLTIWKLLESKFREALTDFNQKEASRISTLDPNNGLRSFTRSKRISFRNFSRMDNLDHEEWSKFCKRASLWISQLPRLSGSWVEFDASQETRVFVSTEGTITVQNSQVFCLSANMHRLTKEGSRLEQEVVLNCGALSELPDMRAFKRMIMRKYEQLQRVSRAKKIHAFSGPVLLYPGPAGLLFHEAVGHRLEGSRLLSAGEGQTFRGQEGKQIFNLPITVRDNPLIKEYGGQKCIGSYHYDDEGVKAQDAVLIEDGVLKGFLSTRAALTKKRHQSNGHARTKSNQRPISRMAVTIIEGKNGEPLDRLKAKLISEIKRQRKPFGMIVYETNGGETDTTNYDFQAFSGDIAYATLIYPNGKEVCVRGVNFVGTPLQSLSNIVAVGDSPELDNGFCGAESGLLPISTISPAVLVRHLELQGKEEELVTPSILKRPQSLKRKRKPKQSRKRRSR
ncbi:MAG: TldD/PmbA family protein [Pseudomonadota bacterium]|jgi:TldD protein